MLHCRRWQLNADDAQSGDRKKRNLAPEPRAGEELEVARVSGEDFGEESEDERVYLTKARSQA